MAEVPLTRLDVSSFDFYPIEVWSTWSPVHFPKDFLRTSCPRGSTEGEGGGLGGEDRRFEGRILNFVSTTPSSLVDTRP